MAPPLPEQVHWIVVRLSGLLNSSDEIATYTGIPARTVRQILKFFREHGTVEPAAKKAQAAAVSEQKRKTKLSDWDKQVSTLPTLESQMSSNSHIHISICCG